MVNRKMKNHTTRLSLQLKIELTRMKTASGVGGGWRKYVNLVNSMRDSTAVRAKRVSQSRNGDSSD